MKKCIFVLPYFGKFNNYFPLFLRSCRYNNLFDWLVFTDDQAKYDYPQNVKVIRISFSEFREMFRKKIGNKIVLQKPYKLCDFKPTYGYVLSDYLRDYEYWGHCDCDLIFGDLNRLLIPLLEKGYDKLFAAGHLTIYKNDSENNSRFMSNYQGRLLFEEFLTVPEICWFDEDWRKDNIHTLFLEQNTKVYSEVLACNPSGKYAYFVQRNYIPSEHRYEEEKYRKALYAWANGRVIRQFEDMNRLITEEFLYMHFQHRKMEMDEAALTSRAIQIIPNKFIPLASIPDSLDEWKKIKKEPLSAYLFVLDGQKERIVRKLKKIVGRS